MNLSMDGELGDAYHSGSQRARVVTEAWGEDNLYCPNCSSPKLTRLSHNTKASDFSCPKCKFWYQLKGQKKRIGKQINDGAYGTMLNAIQHDETPNFYFMHYDLLTWSIKNLLLIPSFAFPTSAIIKRNPTTPKGRNQPWIGCNIALHRIPVDARIAIISDGKIVSPSTVRARYHGVKPLADIEAKNRGWVLDVLNVVRRLGKTEFKNADIYAFIQELEQHHPGNRHIKDKIRQKLQVLRDTGFLHHPKRDTWIVR